MNAAVDNATGNGLLDRNTFDLSMLTPTEWLGGYAITKLSAIMVVTLLMISYGSSVYKYKTSQLSKIPGPWYAPWTVMHLQWMFARGTIWKYVHKQHQKHGPIIRLGPRQVWVSEKTAIKDILLKTDLPKVTMYSEISRDRNSPGLFGEM